MPRPRFSRSADPIAQQAAEWLVRLSGDDPVERAQAHEGFQAWKRADLRHAEAAARMEGLIRQTEELRDLGGQGTRSVRAALDAALTPPHPRARRAGTASIIALTVGLAAGLFLHACPPSYLMADVRTGTGQWKTETLEDGSRITLDSASAVDLRFDTHRRTVRLLQGDVLVQVTHDPSRPFLVSTDQGWIRALGTRFVVSREGAATVLTMLKSKVEVQATGKPRMSALVQAGEQVRITRDGIGPIRRIDPRSVDDAWSHHQLVVEDQPLTEVLDTLNRYRPGLIRYDRAELAGRRVSAVLPLDDTDRALQLLAINFPALRLHTLTPYLVIIDARAPR